MIKLLTSWLVPSYSQHNLHLVVLGPCLLISVTKFQDIIASLRWLNSPNSSTLVRGKSHVLPYTNPLSTCTRLHSNVSKWHIVILLTEESAITRKEGGIAASKVVYRLISAKLLPHSVCMGFATIKANFDSTWTHLKNTQKNAPYKDY